jgi:hypothetical protein
MARNQPMTDAEIEGLRDEMREQRADIRDFLEGEGVDVSGWDDNPVSDTDAEPAESD